MDKITKLNSRQGGAFSASTPLVDFDIPEGMNIDMTKSHLVLNCSLNNDGTSGITCDTLRKTNFAAGEVNLLVPPVIMVQNCHLSGSRSGMLEDIRDINVLKSNLMEYSQDNIEKVCQSYYGFNGINDGVNMMGSPFRDLVKEGTTASTNKSHDMKIKMSDLFGLGEHTVSTDKTGQLTMHLELDFSNINTRQAFGNTVDDNNDGGYWTAVESRSSTTADKSSNGALGATRQAEDKGQIAAATVPGAVYQMTRDYDSIEDSPFWVSQQLRIGYDINGGDANQFETKTVSGISYNPANKKISLTLDTALNGGAVTQLDNVSLRGVDSPANTFVVNNATLVVYEDMMSKPADKIQYKTFTVEKDTENALTTYSKNYYIEPECANLIIIAPENGSGYIGDLDISTYRLRVNGEDLTNRAITMNSPEHYDRLGRTFLNMDMPLKSIREKTIKVSNQRAVEQGTPSVKMIAECFAITNSAKQVEVDINSGNGVRNIYLFKEVIREL
tara:strand:- start:407 stop:1909 length:1503 start_codon:yes stop_codon:yes gene_type:complete